MHSLLYYLLVATLALGCYWYYLIARDLYPTLPVRSSVQTPRYGSQSTLLASLLTYHRRSSISGFMTGWLAS